MGEHIVSSSKLPHEPQEELDEESDGTNSEKSALASEISRLKAVTFEAVAKRERVPQPMFWSLFHSKIKDLQAKKRARRLLDGIFGQLK